MSAVLPFLFGQAGTAATATSAATAATSGAFGTAGAFGWAQTMSTLGLGATALSAVGGGRAASDAYKANAKAQEQQALYAEDQALRNEAAEKRETADQLSELRREQRQERGRRMAAWGASGVQMAGSPLKVMESLDYQDSEDAATLLTGSLARRQNILYAGRSSALSARQQGSIYRMQASSSAAGGYWKGLSTLALGGRYYG